MLEKIFSRNESVLPSIDRRTVIDCSAKLSNGNVKLINTEESIIKINIISYFA